MKIKIHHSERLVQQAKLSKLSQKDIRKFKRPQPLSSYLKPKFLKYFFCRILAYSNIALLHL